MSLTALSAVFLFFVKIIVVMKQFRVTYTLNGVKSVPIDTSSPVAVVENLSRIAMLSGLVIASLSTKIIKAL